MRQAGRVLPPYRELRQRYSLRELFLIPDLAAQITQMPVDLLGVDAAILFSDIAVIAPALGLNLDFREGPLIEPQVTPPILKELVFVPEALAPVIEAIRHVKGELKVPLIGFCGGPFTVATYFIGDAAKAKQWLYRDPTTFQQLLKKIEEISAEYLQMQVQAGVDAIQIFDSCAHILPKDLFQTCSLLPLKRFAAALPVPVIFFMRGGAAHLEEFPCPISLDEQIPLIEARKRTRQPLQGNLDPDLLFAPLPFIRQKTEELLTSMQKDPAFILNLGHGLKPDTPLAAVQCLVETVKNRLF